MPPHKPNAGDLLWQLGDKSPPNDGFTAARIFPTQAAIAAAEAAAAAAAGGEGSEGEAAGAADTAAGQLGELQLAGGGGSADAEGSEAGAGAPAGEAAGAAAGGAVDMDSLLEAAVLAGLHSLKNADLPIQAGDFYTKHMVPAKPEGEGAGRGEAGRGGGCG